MERSGFVYSLMPGRRKSSVILFAYCGHVSVKIAFGVQRDKGHSTGHSVLNVRIEEVGRLSSAGGCDHHSVGIAGINPCSDMLPMKAMAEGSEDKSRIQWASFYLESPFLWFIRNHRVIRTDLAAGCPAGGSVLAVTDRTGFDTVKRFATKHFSYNKKRQQ